MPRSPTVRERTQLDNGNAPTCQPGRAPSGCQLLYDLGNI